MIKKEVCKKYAWVSFGHTVYYIIYGDGGVFEGFYSGNPREADLPDGWKFAPVPTIKPRPTRLQRYGW